MERISPSHGWRHTAQLLHLELDDLTTFAFDYLEARGFRFLVHFGTRTALEMAIKESFTRVTKC